MKKAKSKLTCFECGSSYALDLGKLSADAKYIKCMKCGKPIPILARLVKNHSRDDAAAPSRELPVDVPEAPPKTASVAAVMPFWEADGVDDDEADEEAGWMATYGDMMSILLIFFVLLFSISTVDKQKYEVVMQSISAALGGIPTSAREAPPLKEAPPTVDPSALRLVFR